MFRKKTDSSSTNIDRLPEFGFLKNDDIYMDNACQSPRPQPVIDAMDRYYQSYNACGGRVKYKWGQQVDSEVEETRQLVIDYLGLSKRDYICTFTLNTTYGINLILGQLPSGAYHQVVTSEIEHNSVFLPTISLAQRFKIPRKVLARADDGSLIYALADLEKSVVVVNTTSNIDGRLLTNIKQLISDTHKSGGIVIIDAAQTMAHYHELLIGCQADAICFSAHKMYAGSLGVIVIRKDLLKTLAIGVVGGGMVSIVNEQGYTLLTDDMNSWLEPGLQAYSEIISLKNAILWLKNVRPGGLSSSQHIEKISKILYQGLLNIQGLKIINSQASSLISVYSNNVDAHRLATFLSASGIMVRSGYFCCHYFLLEKQKFPPLLRFSIGLQTTEADVEKVIGIMRKITKG